EVSAVGARFKSKLSGNEHAHEVAAGEKQDVSGNGAHTFYNPVSADAHMFRRFTFGAAVTKQVPSGSLTAHLGLQPPFILTIVPFNQVRIDHGLDAQPCELARMLRSLQGTCEHACKS